VKPLTNAERAMCSTCHEKRAWLGERECGDCLMETRMGLWLQSEHALPGDWDAPWSMSVDEALAWASGGAIHAEPRITEVPLPASQEAQSMARRVTAWVGLLLLCAFTAGLLLGRFA